MTTSSTSQRKCVAWAIRLAGGSTTANQNSHVKLRQIASSGMPYVRSLKAFRMMRM